MKNSIFTKYLPFVAAVILAASCGKDNDGDSIVAQPSSIEESAQTEPTTESTNTVSIPFSVRVGGGKGLSKIQYVEKDGEFGKLVEREFTPSDCGTIQLTVSGGATALLDLKSRDEGGKTVYYFDGVISVLPEYLTDFKNGGIDLTGTFTTNGESDTYYSTTSLLDLEQKCKHVYKAEFKSNADNIMLVDQNAYLSVTVAETQTKFDLTFNGEATARTFTPNDDHKIWIAVPCGGGNDLPTVKGTMISVGGKDLTPGTVYKVDRTKEVDLGPGFNVLWTTCNLGADNPGEYGNYYAYGETTGYAYRETTGYGSHDFSGIKYKGTENPLSSVYDAATAALGEGYRMPTGGSNSEQLALANCRKTWEQQDGNNGYKFYTDYGSVFLPAAGCCYGRIRKRDGSYGFYWSSTPGGESNAGYLYFYSGYADVYSNDRADGRSVRAVRSL